MKKKILSLLLATAMLATMMVGCSSSSESTTESTTSTTTTTTTEASGESTERMSITLAGIAAGMQTFPAYVAQELGYFDELNIDVEILYFESGPVQMESAASGAWDVCATGIGGILIGCNVYDTQIIAVPHSDDGTQYLFVREDSAIAAAGQGNSPLSDEIWGDAASWTGAQILCSAGTVLQYTTIKMLNSFGLSMDDVEFVSMDTPTTNASFLQGEGDVAVITGTTSFDADKADYIVAATGPQVAAGLDCCVVASEDAVANKEAEVTAFLTGYMRAVEWMAADREGAVDLMLEFCDVSGKSTTQEAAEIFMAVENYYSVEDNLELLGSGSSDTPEIETRILGVLEFFIDAGSYMEGDDELFVGHVNPSFMEAVAEAGF